jgi:S1-C subfamily serine protease
MATRVRAPLFLLALLLAPGFLGPPASGVRADDAKGNKKLYQKVLKASVWVVVVKGRVGKVVQTGNGTGWVADRTRGLVITNYHVVAEFDPVQVFFPAFSQGELITDRAVYQKQFKSIPGKVIARDKAKDLAVIQLALVPPGAEALALAPKSAGPNETVHSLGNPVDQRKMWRFSPWKVQRVIPADLSYEANGQKRKLHTNVLLTQPLPRLPESSGKGASGGPLVNARGELVGVAHGVAQSKKQYSALFIDLTAVKPFLKSARAKLPALARKGSAIATKDKDKGDNRGKPKPDPAPQPDPAEKREQLAAAKLNLAEMLEKAGKIQKAKERYEKIIADFPDTKAAKMAKQLLEKLKP